MHAPGVVGGVFAAVSLPLPGSKSRLSLDSPLVPAADSRYSEIRRLHGTDAAVDVFHPSLAAISGPGCPLSVILTDFYLDQRKEPYMKPRIDSRLVPSLSPCSYCGTPLQWPFSDNGNPTSLINSYSHVSLLRGGLTWCGPCSKRYPYILSNAPILQPLLF